MLHFLLSTSVLSFYIDVVLTLSILPAYFFFIKIHQLSFEKINLQELIFKMAAILSLLQSSVFRSLGFAIGWWYVVWCLRFSFYFLGDIRYWVENACFFCWYLIDYFRWLCFLVLNLRIKLHNCRGVVLIQITLFNRALYIWHILVIETDVSQCLRCISSTTNCVLLTEYDDVM